MRSWITAGALTGATVLAFGSLTACFSPKGGFMPSPDGAITYYSYEMRPVTVRLMDLRSNEEVFVMDVPVGKQLVIDFLEGEGHDPVFTPDLMKWEVMPMGQQTGRIHNALAVPRAQARRLEVEYRQGPEYIEAPEVVLRSDQVLQNAEWWRPEGGPMPDKRDGGGFYDD